MGAEPARRLRGVRRASRPGSVRRLSDVAAVVARCAGRVLGCVRRLVRRPVECSGVSPDRGDVDARRRVVPRWSAQLRRARAAPGGASRRTPRRSCRSARAGRASSGRGRSSPTRWRAAVSASPSWVSGSATGSSRTFRTSPRRRVAFLATASLGAIWSSCAPEFGVRAVTDRWAQVDPKVLLAVDGYRYGEKDVDRSGHVAEIVAALPTLSHVVRLPYLDPSGPDGWSALLDHDTEVAATSMAFESGAVRPSALRALFLGHHRPAESDRARSRWHRTRTRQDAGPALRPRPGRSVQLVHDDRLDDVELPRFGRAGGRDRGALRRRPRLARPVDAVGVRRRRAARRVRRERPVRHGLPQGRVASG